MTLFERCFLREILLDHLFLRTFLPLPNTLSLLPYILSLHKSKSYNYWFSHSFSISHTSLKSPWHLNLTVLYIVLHWDTEHGLVQHRSPINIWGEKDKLSGLRLGLPINGRCHNYFKQYVILYPNHVASGMPYVTSLWLYVKETDVLINLNLNSHFSPLAIVLGRADMEHFNYCTTSYWALLELERDPGSIL